MYSHSIIITDNDLCLEENQTTIRKERLIKLHLTLACPEGLPFIYSFTCASAHL